jgi:hypothetical protein
MTKLGTTISLLAGILFWSNGLSQTCLSTGSGDWNNTSTWNCDGTNRLPTCGDTVLVAASHIVTVTNQNDYQGCGAAIVLDISGEMSFNNGNKLELPCNSLVSIQTGGAVYKSIAGGDTSTLISICDTNIWTAADGRLDGPTSFGGFILPVELIRLEAERLNQQEIKVSWTTASEINSDYFTLYNGADTKEWKVIDVLPGAGFSNTVKEYEVVLRETDLNGYFFRLEQTDYDGSTEELGNVRLIDLALEATEAIFWPNPANEKLFVDVSVGYGDTQIALIDQQGQEVQQWEIPARTMTASLNLDPSFKAQGVYFVRITDEKSTRMGKLMIQ